MKPLYVVAWFAWILSALGQGQINLNNRGLALVNDSTGKPLTGTTFVAAVLYGSSDATVNKAFLPSPFRASTTTYPGTWNPAAVGGPGAIATLTGFNPGTTVSLKVVVWDSAVFATWEAASAALQANKSTVPTQVGLSSSFTYAIPVDPLAIPGGLEKFSGLTLKALSNSGPANQAPTAVGQSLSVNSGQTLAITLAGTDPEGASLTYTVVNQPVSGTLAGTGVNRVYTPKAGFSGSDNFTFKVNDGSLDSAVVTVAISVKPVTVNQAPTADSQNLSVAVGEAKDIGLTAKDPENAKLTYTILTQPANGTLTGTPPALKYTPKTGFTGADSFTFKVNDGSLDSALATISISVSEAGAQINLNNRGLALVNDAAGKPLVGATYAAKILYGASEAALNQSFVASPFRDGTTTYPGTWNPAAVGGPGAIATLAGFKLGATVTLKVAVWDTAVFATWELAEAALKTGKSPVPTQAGLSTVFTYTVPTDSLAIPTGMEKFSGLKLTALSSSGSGNQAPTAAGQSLAVTADQILPIVLAGTDPEGASLTYTVVAPPANGTLSGVGANRLYTPRAGFTGADSFTFKVNDGSLDSAVATVAITVKALNVVVIPPEFPTEPTPWDKTPCICGPLVGNYQTNQIHTWHVLAEGGSLDLQLTTTTVNLNDPQTTIVDAFDGTNLIASVTVSYTAADARANGLHWEKSASVNIGTFARGKVIRLESRIGGTPITQTHYNLQFCGARWLALDLPSFKALEEDHAAYRFNVKSGESLVLDLDNVGIPTPATAFWYRLISPLGVIVKSGTNTIVAGPELTVVSPSEGLWTLEMRPIGGEHYLLDKTTGADRHAYLDWYTSQRGIKEVHITVNGKPAKGMPFEVQLTRQREVGLPDPSDVVVTAIVTNSWARFVEIPNGFYKVTVKPLFNDIPAIDYQEDWIYCNNPVTNLFAFLSNSGTVNQAPTADSQNVSLATGESRDIGLTGRDPENAKLTYTIVTQPANGTLTGIAPAIKYTPKTGFTGADNFTFKVNDGSLDSALATISISVSEAGAQINLNNRGLALVNDAAGKPLVGATYAAKILYGASEAALNQSFVASPFRDGTTTYPGTWNPAAVGGPGAIATLAGFKLGATVTLKVAVWDTAVFATWELAEAALKTGKSPVPTQAGLSTVFTYTVPTDSLAIPTGMEKFSGLKLTALSSSGSGNQAPTAAGQSLAVTADQILPIVLAGTDPEGASLTYTVVAPPANGTLSGVGANRLYTPRAGFTGADSFTFKVNDGSLDSAVATVAITVKALNVVVIPPEFPTEPTPWDKTPCICGPLVGNYQTNQIHTWHVLAEGGSLDLQLTTTTVNLNDPQTTIVDAFDGTNLIASVTVSYTAADARANGLHWEKSASVNIGTFARGKVIRLESRIGGTPITQTHYNLQFCGARWLALDLPSFKALEEDHAAYRFNVKSGESLVLDLDNVGIPTPATAFWYRLISPLGVIVKSGTNTIVAGPELTVVSPSEGLWTLEMRPIGGEHYLLDKTTGADRHAYLDWYTSQRGIKEVHITVNGKPAKGMPFEVQLTRQREVGLPDPSDVVVTTIVTNGWARFVEIPNGYYKVTVKPLLKDIPAIDYQDDWIYCNNPVTNLFAFNRLNKLPIFDAIANNVIDEGKPFNLVLKATDPDGSPLTFSLVGGPVGLTVTSAGALTWTPSEEQGPSTNGVGIAVTDGIDSVTNRFTLVVQEVNAVPQIAAVAKQTLDEGKALALNLSATDTDLPKQPLVFQLISGPAGLTVSPAGQVSWVAGEDFGGKTETVKFSVSDGTQTVASEFQLVINEVNAPPQVATISKQTLDEGKALAFTVAATDSDLPKQALEFRLVSGPAGLTVSLNGQVAWVTSEESGGKTETVRLTLSDGLVVVPVEFQVTVNEVNEAPSLAGVDNQTLDARKPLVILLKAKDADLPAQKLAFGLASGPQGMTVSEQGQLVWTPTIDQGGTTNSVEVWVNDGVAKASTSFVVIVRPSNTPPTLADIQLRRVSETGSLTFTLAASDNDQPAQKLTFALISGPEGLSVNPNTGQVMFRPTEAQGPSTNRVVVRVTDNGIPALSATNSFTVVVLEINQVPQLASVDNQTVEALKPLVVRLSATDADIPTQKLTFGLVDGPAGMSVDPVAGIVSWTPSLVQASAQYSVTVSVSDGIRVVTQSFEIKVESSNQAPFFISLVNRNVRELNTVNFKLIGRDLDQPAQKLTYGLVSGPSGLEVSEVGQVIWTPTEAQGPSTNTIAVRVTDNGTPSLSTTNLFTILVAEANTAPTLVNAYNRFILESVGLNFTLIGRDADLPAQKLTYTLVSGPKGLTMSDAGVIAWSPTEEQGPSTNTVVVKVTDSAASPLSTTASFVVTVREANAPPVFPLTNLTVVAQSKLSVALKATDVDIPVQILSYRLERGPEGLTVSTNGLLEWTPASALANTTNIVTVSVSDTVTRIQTTFRVLVRPVGSGPGSETKAIQKTYLALVVQPDQTLSLKVVGPAGGRFRVESTTLLGVEWQTVDSIGEIQTLGQDEPVVVPVPVEGTGDFRQFRLKKQ